MAGPGSTAARGLIAFVALCASAVAQVSDAELVDPVAREWRVRELASDAVAHADELEELSRSGDPLRQSLALEAWTRAAVAIPSPRVLAVGARSMVFGPAAPRADVVVARLDLWSALRIDSHADCELRRPEDVSSYDEDERLARHPLPLVRAALARKLRFERAREFAESMLLALLSDADERVAAEARASFVLRVCDREASDEALVRAWRALELRDETERVEFLLALDAARCPSRALALLAEATGEAPRSVRGAIEALRISSGAPADADLFLDARPQLAGEFTRLELLFERAAKAARVVQPELGRRAFARFEHERRSDAGAVQRAIAIEVLGPSEVARLALASVEFEDQDRIELFERFHGRSVEWTTAELLPWIDPASRERDLRESVIEILRSSALDARSVELERVFAAALADPDLNVVRAAFLALCKVDDPAPWGGALREAWERFDESTRLELLPQFPRSARLEEFVDGWISWASRDPSVRAAAGELLGSFVDSPSAHRLSVALRRWIDEDLASSDDLTRARELRIAGLVRALHSLDGERGVDALDRVAQWSSGRSDEIGKAALWALGQSVAGRARLPGWLTADAPTRFRIEAELMLTPQGDASALEWTVRDYSRGDLQLKGRAIDALQSLSNPQAARFLRDRALDEGEELQLRLRAIDALSRRADADTQTLKRLVDPSNPELSSSAWGAWARVGGEPAREAVHERLLELTAKLDDPIAAERTLVLSERGVLLRLAGELELFDDDSIAAWRVELDREAASDLRARFIEERSSRAGFSYGAELEFGRALARSGRLASALERDSYWRRWDAMVLDALGAAAIDEDELTIGRELLAASYIASLGELRDDLHRSQEFELRQRMIGAAERARDWPGFAALAAALNDDVRSRRVSRRSVERLLGGFDPAARIDGQARLDAAVFQARAHERLAAGDLEGARDQRDRAAERTGFSDEALAAQARLDAELGARTHAVK